MEYFDVVKNRRSVRKYLTDKIDRDVIEKIVDAGRWAPTARNIQPWHFVVVQDAETRKRVADITDYGKFIAESPVLLIVFCEDAKYYLEDGAAAVENILLAAADLGLGTCWVAGDKKPYCGQISEIVGAPNNMHLVALIALGKPDGTPLSREKKPLSELIHWEKFNISK